MKISKREEKALATIRRLNTQKKNAADAIAKQADRVISFGVSVGAAVGISYWMARYNADPDKQEWLGWPKELWISGGLLIAGLWVGSKKGRGAQMAADLLLSASTGVAAAYGGAWGDAKGEEARLKAAGA